MYWYAVCLSHDTYSGCIPYLLVQDLLGAILALSPDCEARVPWYLRCIMLVSQNRSLSTRTNKLVGLMWRVLHGPWAV